MRCAARGTNWSLLPRAHPCRSLTRAFNFPVAKQRALCATNQAMVVYALPWIVMYDTAGRFWPTSLADFSLWAAVHLDFYFDLLLVSVVASQVSNLEHALLFNKVLRMYHAPHGCVGSFRDVTRVATYRSRLRSSVKLRQWHLGKMGKVMPNSEAPRRSCMKSVN